MTAPPVLEPDAPADGGNDTQEPAAPIYGDAVKTPALLDPATKPADICKTVREMFEAQKDLWPRRLCEGEVHERRRGGESNIWVQKDANEAKYTIYVPHGTRYLNQFYRKDDRLCNRFVSQLYTDPAVPEGEPENGSDEAEDAAEFATRVLADVRGEAILDDVSAHKQAQQFACSWGSGLIWYYTNPQGGGRQPIEVTAHADALTFDEALIDPKTGQKWEGATKTRYVMPDGTLTDDASQAALRWMPRIARQVVRRSQVRYLPDTARDLWEAEGLIYACYETWDTLVAWFPELANVSEEERDHAITYRYGEAKYLLRRDGRYYDPKPKEGLEGQGRALLMIFWHVECDAYPDGAYVVCVGDKLCPVRGEWLLNRLGKREKRDLPWTEVVQFEGVDGKQGLMHYFGPASEYRGDLYGRFDEMLDKALNRKVFVPSHSTLQPQDLELEFRTVFSIPPGSQPFYEDIPPIPKELGEMIDRNDTEMDDATSLAQASQSSSLASTSSGRQALAVVSEAQSGLSDITQNANRAVVRGCRVILQEIATNYTVPQMLKFKGEDGLLQMRRWLGSDIGSTRDVRIKPGTGSMLNPTQKVQVAAEYAQLAGLPPDDVRELLLSNALPSVALEDDPARMRIKRQVAEWEQGPPEGWMPPVAPVDPLTGAPAVTLDPMTGVPMPVPPPPDPILARIWEPVPADQTPRAAAHRVRELVNVMCGTRYLTFPPEWRVPVEMEFAKAQQVLAPPPMPMPGDGAEPGAGPKDPLAPQGEEKGVIDPV